MKAQVKLDLAHTTNPAILIDGQNYVVSMTGKPDFLAADIVAHLVVCTTSITGLRTAMLAPLSETKTDDIAIARDAVDRNLTILGGKVEGVANAPGLTDEQRIAKIHAAGMSERNHPHPQKQKFTASNTKNSLVVHLTAEGQVNANLWEGTQDVVEFGHRIAFEATTKSTTDVTVTAKGEWAFFHKPVKPDMVCPWEGPIFLTVT